MFAPEQPITGKKLCYAINDYYHFSPGTTKKIKSKHIEESTEDMDTVDDNSMRFHVDTLVFKVFGKVEHRGEVTDYDPVNKLYHIVYDNDETKEYYHNKVRGQPKKNISMRKQKRKPKSAKFHYLHSKYTPKNSDYVEHVMTLTVENIRSITSL